MLEQALRQYPGSPVQDHEWEPELEPEFWPMPDGTVVESRSAMELLEAKVRAAARDSA